MNHGIWQTVMGEVLYSAMEFFNLPSEEKLKFMSSDVHKRVRYGTRLRDGADKIQFWRVFLKNYASPLEDWIGSWPKHRCAQVPIHNAYSLFNYPFGPNFSFSSRYT